MSIKRLLRTTGWVLFVVAIALIAGLAWNWPGSTPQQRIAQDRPDSTFGRYLAQLEAAVNEERAADPQADCFSARLRTAAIGLSMSGPLAFVTEHTLLGLGNSAALRAGLFFMMPLADWMSEPFLYPIDSDQDPGPRLQALIEARARQGIAVTLDNVGDASHSPEQVQEYRAFYRRVTQAAIDNGQPRPLYLSVKLSALVEDLSSALGADGADKRAEILNALRDLLRAPDQRSPAPVFIRIDMEEYAYKDLTLQLFRELVESDPRLALDNRGQLRVGVVIQAYLRDSAQDLGSLAAWGRTHGWRVPVRLVKGAYLEHERSLARKEDRPSPVWDNKSSTDANYLLLAEFLLRHPRQFDARFATHNLNSQAHVMELANQLHYWPNQIEFQMLHGMGESIKVALVKLGYAVRDYVPAGSLNRGLGYAGRRFAELTNPDNALARTLRGDISALAETPSFVGDQDRADAQTAVQVLMAADQGWGR